MDQPVTGVSRRNMLIAGGGAVAAIGAFAASPLANPLTAKARELVASQSWARRFLSLAGGGYEEWQALVGSTFSLGGGSTMRLSGVQPLASTGDRPLAVTRRAAFQAVFDLPRGQSLAGDLIYTATHSQYGPFQVFLSASAGAGMPARMTAVFN